MRRMRGRPPNDHSQHEVERQRGHQQTDDAKHKRERVARNSQELVPRFNLTRSKELSKALGTPLQQLESEDLSTPPPLGLPTRTRASPPALLASDRIAHALRQTSCSSFVALAQLVARECRLTLTGLFHQPCGTTFKGIALNNTDKTITFRRVSRMEGGL